MFYLTTLNLPRFLTKDPPDLQEGANNQEFVIALDVWKHSDFLCNNYIVNGLDNTLYGVYSAMKSAKELWISLGGGYKAKKSERKKFIIDKFLEYKMIDSKTVISQVQESHILLDKIHAEKMPLSESYKLLQSSRNSFIYGEI